MVSRPPCGCTICGVESHLQRELSSFDPVVLSHLFSPCPHLRGYSDLSSLLSSLRNLSAKEVADEYLSELLSIRAEQPALIESLLVIAFVPMLHRIVRQVSTHQSTLTPDDISQQALTFLVKVLQSNDLRGRRSHFAFAISRGVKRQLFGWAKREGSTPSQAIEQFSENMGVQAGFERQVFMRHFLHHSLRRGVINSDELNLLIDFKLGEVPCDSSSNSCPASNAVRQKMKRLLAKLRRAARQTSHPNTT